MSNNVKVVRMDIVRRQAKPSLTTVVNAARKLAISKLRVVQSKGRLAEALVGHIQASELNGTVLQSSKGAAMFLLEELVDRSSKNDVLHVGRHLKIKEVRADAILDVGMVKRSLKELGIAVTRNPLIRVIWKVAIRAVRELCVRMDRWLLQYHHMQPDQKTYRSSQLVRTGMRCKTLALSCLGETFHCL